MKMNFNIIIPARKGSKGLPRKNQILLDETFEQIPREYHDKVIISTDDDTIISRIKSYFSKCNIHHRSKESARDSASTKECIIETVRDFKLTGDIIMLYLTYPEREWKDIMHAYKWFVENQAKSLLCREEILTHPYLCLHDTGNNRGRQIVPHDYYRRQDYPKCFKICHMISIFKTIEIKNLNNNLYNENTLYYKIPQTIDVDTLSDLKKYKEKYDS